MEYPLYYDRWGFKILVQTIAHSNHMLELSLSFFLFLLIIFHHIIEHTISHLFDPYDN